MANSQSPRIAAFSASSTAVLDTLYADRPRTSRSQGERAQAAQAPEAIWGQFNNYRSNGLAGSAVAHIVVLGLILGGATFAPHVVQQVQKHENVTLIAPSPDSYALPVAKKIASGGGGGGERDHLEAPKGRLPKLAVAQITPPAIVVHNEHPKLAVEPTVIVPQVRVAENHMPNLGVPSAAPMPSAPPSNGTGSGGGIGGGVFKVGGGISAPQAVSTPDPEYTEEARNAKTQGTCVLWLIVDQQGNPRDVRVVRGLGFGLDAKAIDAVKQWRFQPALKDGRPVNVQISVEVGFKLY